MVPIRVQNVATGVVLPQEMSIGEGQTSALTATPDPEGTILKGLVWSSSDAETVYVDSYGNVTGLKAGSAVITVSNAAGLKASCTVTVTAGENPPAGDITAPTAPADLKATNVTSSSITVTWAASSDDTGVAGYEIFVNGISAGRVTGREAVIGNLKADTQYEITVKAYDAAGNVSVAVSITARTAAAAPGNAQQPGSGTAGGTVSGNPTVTAVQTGDESPIAVFVIAAAAAATVAAAVIMRQPRRRTVRGKRRPRNSEKP